MNVVREINRINDRELDLGATGSWHDDYKDSAYIFIGGLHSELTEGDVIAIFSQYGEVMDVNLPRDKNTGKMRGFGFLMYEDQRSTILAVDNFNGAKVLERTLRVDHVKDYKQQKVKNEDGEWMDREEQSLNAKPEIMEDNDAASESSASSGPEIDPEDPMRDYLLAQRKEQKALKKAKKAKIKGKHKDESPEERRARKQRRKEKKEKKHKKSEGMKAVEELLNQLEGRDHAKGTTERRRRSPSPYRRDRSQSRERRETQIDIDSDGHRHPESSRYHSPNRTPTPKSPPRSRRPSSRSRLSDSPSRGKRARYDGDNDSRSHRYDQASPPHRR